MGAMAPQPTGDQQQYPPQAHFPQGQQPPQQPPPGYNQQPQMDPAAAAQMTQQTHPGHPQAYGTPLVSLSQQPAPVACPHCGHRGMTSVGYESGGFTQYVRPGML